MLSKEANELLTRIGPETAMGRMLRQYWVPALRTASLEVDGAPLRIRLFGENFVAFRDSNGQVGFLDEGCPHRGASLALGRNEECGLRCLYHGWKIDVNGKVVETPSEPADSNLAAKVKVKHYPVREAGGMVWVWLGEGAQPAQFPAFAFTALPTEKVVARRAYQNCNWVQALEGLLDSAHVSSLHRAWLPQGDNAMQGAFAGVTGSLAPKYEIVEQLYGFTANAKRALPDGTEINRYTEYVLPFYCFIPNTLKTQGVMACGIPIDDKNTYFWEIIWDTAAPLDAQKSDAERNFGNPSPDPDNYYQPRYGADKIWGQDRELMKQGHYTGFRALPFEDFAIQESQGAIADRTKEHLGASDVAIIRMRRLLLDLAQQNEQGKLPPRLTRQIAYDKIRAIHEIVAPAEKQLEVIG
jgi:phenylpropionate dioxygenase-like ring-hydroxylating dioxygenase large terminal subunit